MPQFDCELMDLVLLFDTSGVHVKGRVSSSQYSRWGINSWEKSSYTCKIWDTIFYCVWDTGIAPCTDVQSSYILNIVMPVCISILLKDEYFLYFISHTFPHWCLTCHFDYFSRHEVAISELDEYFEIHFFHGWIDIEFTKNVYR